MLSGQVPALNCSEGGGLPWALPVTRPGGAGVGGAPALASLGSRPGSLPLAGFLLLREPSRFVSIVGTLRGGCHSPPSLHECVVNHSDRLLCMYVPRAWAPGSPSPCLGRSPAPRPREVVQLVPGHTAGRVPPGLRSRAQPSPLDLEAALQGWGGVVPELSGHRGASRTVPSAVDTDLCPWQAMLGLGFCKWGEPQPPQRGFRFGESL